MPDLKASVSFTADGTTKKYYFNFDYINPEYIKVNVGGTELSYPSDYSVIDRAVELAEVPAKDMLIQVYRQTPSDRLIEWADGAFIKAAQMSLSDLQQLHLIEESQDYIILNCISSYPDGKNFNALGHRIINVADPVDTQDAVTKHYMESVQDGFVQRNQAIETHVQQMQTDVTQKKTQTEQARDMAQKWAESPTSPDGNNDSASDTGKTQSAKEWAKQAERAAQVFQDFTGATSTEDGTAGKVPQPKAGQQGMFLSGGGGFKKAVTKVNDKYTPDDTGNISLPFIPESDRDSFVQTSGEQNIGGKKKFADLWLLSSNTTTEGGELCFYAPYNPASVYAGFDLFKRDTNYYMRFIDYNLTGGGTLIPFQFNLNSGDMNTKKGVVEQIATNGTGSSFKYIRYTSGLQMCWCLGTASSQGQIVTLPVSFSSAVALAVDAGTSGGSGGRALGSRWKSGNKVELSISAGTGYCLFVIGTV